MRVLVVRVGAMGDVLHALPAVTALRRALPEAHIGWAIEPRWRPLLEDGEGRRPVVDAVHAVETKLWQSKPASMATLRSVAGLRASLRAEHYDVCVDLQGSMRSAVIGRMAGARAFHGPAEPREGQARWLYGQRVRTEAAHVIEQAAELMSAAVGQRLAPAEVELPADAGAERWWAEQQQSQMDDRPYVLLAPGAGWGAKQWPGARFGALARRLGEEGYGVLVNQAGERDAVTAEVMREAGAAARAMRTDLPQLIAIARRAVLVVAGDTGPLHLAVTLRRPVVALFGPTDPARTGPYGALARVLRHTSSVTDHRRHAATEDGLLQITTETVVEAALALLQKAEAGEETT